MRSGRGRCRNDCNFNLSRLCVSMLIQHKVSQPRARPVASVAEDAPCALRRSVQPGHATGLVPDIASHVRSSAHYCPFEYVCMEFPYRLSYVVHENCPAVMLYISFTRGRSLCGFLHCAV